MKMLLTFSLLVSVGQLYAQSLKPVTLDVSIGGSLKKGTLRYDQVSFSNIGGLKVVDLYNPRIEVNGKSYVISPDQDYENNIARWTCENLYQQNSLGKMKYVYGTNYEDVGLFKKSLYKSEKESFAKVVDGSVRFMNAKFYITLLSCNFQY